jgi:hypothetical protein
MRGFPYRPGGYGGWPKWWEWLIIIGVVVAFQSIVIWFMEGK